MLASWRGARLEVIQVLREVGRCLSRVYYWSLTLYIVLGR